MKKKKFFNNFFLPQFPLLFHQSKNYFQIFFQSFYQFPFQRKIHNSKFNPKYPTHLYVKLKIILT
jgi:hypothetical protein